MITLAILTSNTVRKKTWRRRPNGRRCFFEPLEDRRLLAVIASDGFETANLQGGTGDWTGNWQTSGSPYVTSSSSPQSGSYHALVQGSEDIQRSVDVSGLTDLRLSFGAKLRSFESSDRAQVEARIDGGSWTSLKRFVNGEDDNQYRTYDFAVPAEGDTLEVRFNGLMSSSRRDYWYIDNVEVTGTPAGPPEISISDATATEGDLVNVGSASVFVSAGSGGLDRPRGITFGPDGNFYVASVETDSVLRYDGETGTFLDEFVSPGSGGLDAPRDLVFDSSGRLLVTSGQTDQIIRYNGTDGTFDQVLVDVAGGLDKPQSLTYNSSAEELFVSSANSNEILQYDALSGTFLDAFVTTGSGGLSSPKWQLFTDAGDLLVVSQNGDEILKYDSAGDFQGVFYAVPTSEASTTILMGIARGPDGNLLVGESNNLNTGRVIRLDADTGAFIDDYVSVGDGGLNSPRSITTDSDGNVYVVSYETDEVLRYAPSGNAAFTVSLSAPSGVPVTVDFDTADLSATSGSDYTAVSGKLTFEPGVTSRTVVVPTLDDALEEGNETFVVDLSNPTGGATITDAQGVATIQDDESPDPNMLYVSDISFQSRRGGKQWRAILEIRSDSNADGVGDAGDEVRAGVQVTVNFGGQTFTGTTDENGIFRSDWIDGLGSGSHYANVVDLVLTDYRWDPLDLDLEDDTDGDGMPDDVLVI